MPNDCVIDLSTINPKQERFFKSRKKYIAYGGARGGGKSWAVQRKSILLALNYAGIKILLLRRTYKDLERNHVRVMKPLLTHIAVYKSQEKCFFFPNGSIIELGYCASESDVLQYQGQEYDIIFIDEATQFTEFQFETLTASNRGATPFPKRMYLTCNPGGIGHEWVKRLFVSKRYKENEDKDKYDFIPATVFDNRVLMENDPEYVESLNNLSDGLREAWRDGNWDMHAGRYFNEFDRNIHVVEPFKIPDWWKRYCAIDYGLDCLACVWAAVDDLGNIYIYRNYAEPDKIISQGAKEIIDLSEGEDIVYTVAPPDLWGRSQESAKTKADIFGENGLHLIKGSNDREAGHLAVKDLLKPVKTDGGYEARLKIFSCCTHLIEDLPALQVNIKKPNDCMTEPHDITHLPDALRYFALQYISPSKKKDELTALQKYKKKVLSGKFDTARRYY